MAKLTKRLFEVSGALGDLVFKEMEGTPYIATRPVSFMPGTDAASVARRATFKISSVIAKIIVKMNYIKSAWLSYNRKKRPYRQLVSANYHKVNITDVPENISLVPDNGFELNIKEIILTPAQLKIETAPLGKDKGIDPDTEIRMAMSGIIYLADPIDELSDKVDFIDLYPDIQAMNLETDLSFSINLSTQDTQKLNGYKKQKAYCALLTLDSSKNVIHYSKNYN